MQRISPPSVPPHVPLRVIRETLGLTLDDLADRMADQQGFRPHPDSLCNVENGRRHGSRQLMDAWAQALGIRRHHIRQAPELSDLVASSAEEAA
jgi:transcriptional regulator with XRE-family HTH domain